MVAVPVWVPVRFLPLNVFAFLCSLCPSLSLPPSLSLSPNQTKPNHTITTTATTTAATDDDSACTALEWDPLGLSLAIAQANSSVVLLWFTRQWKARAVDVGVKVGNPNVNEARDSKNQAFWSKIWSRGTLLCFPECFYFDLVLWG